MTIVQHPTRFNWVKTLTANSDHSVCRDIHYSY